MFKCVLGTFAHIIYYVRNNGDLTHKSETLIIILSSIKKSTVQ